MTFRGHIKNGVVALEGDPALPDGASVRVEVLKRGARQARGVGGPTLGQRLMRFAGTGGGLLADMAKNHDHYIRGAARK